MHAPADDAARLARLACFGGLSPYEVTVEGRKCVGLAQVRRRHGALFQAAALLTWSPERLARLLGVSPTEQAAAGAALRRRVAALPLPDDSRAREGLMAAVEHVLTGLGFDLYDDALTPHELNLAAGLARDRYRPLTLDGGAP